VQREFCRSGIAVV